MQPDFAQDPNELFDLVTIDGESTGVTKSRAAVHRDGDWHRAVHVWVIGEDESGPFLMFQRRSLAKDTWPGRLDATVGGHFRAGEGVIETLRETEEEIGVAVTIDELVPAGYRRAVHDSQPEVRDREIQSVFFLRDDRPLAEFSPNPAELMELVRLPLQPLIALLSGDADSCEALVVRTGSTDMRVSSVGIGDFIPAHDDYFLKVALAARRALAGERQISLGTRVNP